MWLTNLADVLRNGGLNVYEVAGWKTRGYLGQQMSGVRSVVPHWTASSPAAPGDYPTLNTILYGTDQTPGPLSQLGLGRGGTVYVCAAGLCNHAGVVDHSDHSNPYAVGIEAEYHPDQGAWPQVQQDAYELMCAVLTDHYGLAGDLGWTLQGHYEVARPIGRKSDPNTLPGGMSGFRQRVQEIIDGGFDTMTPDQLLNHPVSNPIDGHTAPLKDWIVGMNRVAGEIQTNVGRLPAQTWDHPLPGDPMPDGQPYSDKARQWLTDRARDAETLRRHDALLTAIAAKLGVEVPDAG